MAPSADACGASATALAADARGASEGGFSLVETIIASGVMITAVVGLAQLFVMSTRSNVAAKSTSITAVLAQQKMEQLRSLEWGFDALGLPNTDTTTNTANVPMTANGGTGLSPSPTGASNPLKANTIGWVDYVDRYGNSLGGGTTTPPAGTSYIRRWSVEPLPTNPNNTIVLQVLVTPIGLRTADDTTDSVRRTDQEARIMSVKTRKAS
jgi:type II secretory pathway pseudopilin PulG